MRLMAWQWIRLGCLCVMLAGYGAVVSAQDAPATPAPAKDAKAPADNSKAPDAQKDQRYLAGPPSADQALADQLPDQAQWLTAGDDRFVGLTLPETTGNPQGAVLIVSDIGLSADAGLAGGLRRKLPDFGWFTLSIGLPLPPVPALPPIKAANDQAAGSAKQNAKPAADKAKPVQAASGQSSGAGGAGVTIDVAQPGGGQQPPDSAKDFMKAAEARLAAGLAYLQGAGYGNLALIGVGRGADVIAHYAADNGKKLPTAGMALIWVRADMTGDVAKDLGKALGDGFALPLLDIVNVDQPMAAAQARLGAARRANFTQYQQQWLPLDNRYGMGASDNVVSRVSSWLDVHLKGMKAKAYPAKGGS